MLVLTFTLKKLFLHALDHDLFGQEKILISEHISFEVLNLLLEELLELSFNQFAFTVKNGDFGLVTGLNHGLVEENLLLTHLNLRLLQLDPVEDWFTLCRCLLLKGVDILHISLHECHKFHLLLDQFLLFLLDLQIELFLLQIPTFLDILVLLLVQGVVDCSLHPADQAIVLSFLFSLALMHKNLLPELFNRDHVLLNFGLLSLSCQSTSSDFLLKFLCSFIEACLDVSFTFGHQ